MQKQMLVLSTSVTTLPTRQTLSQKIALRRSPKRINFKSILLRPSMCLFFGNFCCQLLHGSRCRGISLVSGKQKRNKTAFLKFRNLLFPLWISNCLVIFVRVLNCFWKKIGRRIGKFYVAESTADSKPHLPLALMSSRAFPLVVAYFL